MRLSRYNLYRPTRTPDGEGGWTASYLTAITLYGGVTVYPDRTDFVCRDLEDVRAEDVICLAAQSAAREDAWYRVIGETSISGAPMKTLSVEAIEKPLMRVETTTPAETTTTGG